MNSASFFNHIPRDKNGYLLISAHRKYSYDEQLYDQQYGISPYDFVAGEGLFNLAKRLGLNLDHPVLELGCGTGRLSVGMLKAFDPDKLLITDASSIFLDLSRRKFQESNLAMPHLGVLQFEDIGLLPDEAFSMIVIRSALHHIDKYEDFLIAASKKLVKGGRWFSRRCFMKGCLFLA